MKKKRIVEWIWKNKYWIATTAAVTALLVVERRNNATLKKQLDIKEGENKNQADTISGLMKGVKNLSYHLGKKSVTSEDNE